MENILKVFLMAFPEWLACIFMVVGLVVTALAAVRLGYGLVVAKTVYKDRQRRGKVRQWRGCRKESPCHCRTAWVHPGLAGLGNQ